MIRRSSIVILLLLGLILSACSTSRIASRSSNPVIVRVLEEAEDLLGTNYCSAGTTPDCFDCSGYVSFCFGRAGVMLPRRSEEQYGAGTAVKKDGLQPGDLVFFRTGGSRISHVGIYVGEDRFIHSSTSKGVIITSLSDVYWRQRYVGARRVAG